MTDSWRDDPAWKLAIYDRTVYPDGAPDTPTPAAELSQPPIWATEYRGSVAVAVWSRLDPRLDGASAP